MVRRDLMTRDSMTPTPAAAAPIRDNGRTIERKARLRLWIRLLRASRFIEGVTRERFKGQFDMTLPRFDVMAALYRKPDGMLMSEIARFLIVSNGNVTGIVDRLVSEGCVARSQRDGDRRTSFITLTRRGRAAFATMAAAHERWIDELLGGVSARDAEQLSAKLKSFRSEWEGEA
jgi:DNA-binding MarR family transcriptional regulator